MPRVALDDNAKCLAPFNIYRAKSRPTCAEPADPANPYRWEDERAAINGKHALFNKQIVRECGARDRNSSNSFRERYFFRL